MKQFKSKRHSVGTPSRKLFSIFCRAVGPGGSSVDFYLDEGGKGLKAVWTNENCPYGPADDVTYEAVDGHNVEHISWKALQPLLDAARDHAT